MEQGITPCGVISRLSPLYQGLTIVLPDTKSTYSV